MKNKNKIKSWGGKVEEKKEGNTKNVNFKEKKTNEKVF